MPKIYNQTVEKPKRQQLRNSSPPAELRLWKELRNRQLLGLKFRRQYSVGRYVVDFYCPMERLAIEIDGSSHDGAEVADYDQRRQQHIEALGIRVLRFTNTQIFKNLSSVLFTIANHCHRTQVSPSNEGEI